MSALTAGILSSAFYYIYTGMQLPAGMLLDRNNTRFLLTVSALVCSLGCFIFSHSHSLLLLFAGRLIIGAGSSFAFLGLTHLLRQHFPLRQFAFMIGLSETLGFLVTVTGIISLGILINSWGWRIFINGAALTALLIAALVWVYIPKNQPSSLPLSTSFRNLRNILCSRLSWINGLFIGLSFTVITVFGGLWAIPFIQLKLACSLQLASIVDAMIFLGAAVSCPLTGYLASHFPRRSLILLSCLTTAVLIMIILFAPIFSALILSVLMFLAGLCCGAYMLAFSIANDLAPAEAQTTNSGFTNTLAMLTAPIFQPLIGFFLDWNAYPDHVYRISDYQWALVTIPLCLLTAGALSFFLPE